MRQRIRRRRGGCHSNQRGDGTPPRKKLSTVRTSLKACGSSTATRDACTWRAAFAGRIFIHYLTSFALKSHHLTPAAAQRYRQASAAVHVRARIRSSGSTARVWYPNLCVMPCVCECFSSTREASWSDRCRSRRFVDCSARCASSSSGVALVRGGYKPSTPHREVDSPPSPESFETTQPIDGLERP